MTPRQGAINRVTTETQINLTLFLDSSEPRVIQTNLPFLSHMLNAFSCHGRLGLSIDAHGDIEVDPHHLIEDTGIALGEALRLSLGNFAGIERSGFFAFPMDLSLAVVAIDLCGRPNLMWNVPPFESASIGGVDPRLFREFFKGFVDGARATVHVHVPVRDNDHHVVESVFKAFGKSLQAATRATGQTAIPSTKGMLVGSGDGA